MRICRSRLGILCSLGSHSGLLGLLCMLFCLFLLCRSGRPLQPFCSSYLIVVFSVYYGYLVFRVMFLHSMFNLNLGLSVEFVGCSW